jgi:purine-binding chemotaxis protein CheW
MKENEKILAGLEQNDVETDEAGSVEEEEYKFLVFKVGNQLYALYADEVREIIGGNPVFYLPFVPVYVRGLINRHGDPYTVFDVHALLEQEQIEADSFLILKLEEDNIAIIITEILEIVKIRESGINTLTSRENEMKFFRGSVTIDGSEVFILHIQNLLQKLEDDLEKE